MVTSVSIRAASRTLRLAVLTLGLCLSVGIWHATMYPSHVLPPVEEFWDGIYGAQYTSSMRVWHPPPNELVPPIVQFS
ncbi:uncharacterized protein B0H18DRAFT_1015342 [Fomitopsis serialis]|uniref:uncharacterized protein n=1 Tax=Fomitopsis serialis TaxID=139415 RepID=UPI0020081B60|nr:uncharacterized protein B0H18DRAFT_1015342 [Neoantrodia serialis]KAH9923351.1 hypothetical protein B0H18DRAFT_1015342 [Neoantrodia serialis]